MNCNDDKPQILQESHDASTNSQSSDSSEAEIAGKETQEVKQVKVLVFLVVAVSVLGAFLVYFYTKVSEEKLFKEHFYDNGNKVC